jgi:hypothetical protein
MMKKQQEREMKKLGLEYKEIDSLGLVPQATSFYANKG